MIDIILFSAAGFLVASLIALLTLPYLTSRAEKSAVNKLRVNMPFTAAEMLADKDQLRAEHAVTLCKLEAEIEKQNDKMSAQNIEINKLNQKISATNKISKAGKLALEEVRSKEIDLNDRLRQRDADYAGLEQRSRRMLRENRDLKAALKKEGKSLPQEKVVLNTSPEKEQANKRIAELEEQLEVALNKPGIAGNSGHQKLIRLPKAKLPSALGGEKSDDRNGKNNASIAMLQEEILNMAAQMAHITATIEGDNSKITALLDASDRTNDESLSARMQALMAQSAQKVANKTPAVPTTLPKAKGLETAKKSPPTQAVESAQASTAAKTKPTQIEKA